MLTPARERRARKAVADRAGSRLEKFGWPGLLRDALAEIDKLRTENAQLRADMSAAADRIHKQSELLSKRAERPQLSYDPAGRVYRDEDGCPTLDQFGQPLG